MWVWLCFFGSIYEAGQRRVDRSESCQNTNGRREEKGIPESAMDTTNTEKEGRDAVQPPVREDAVQGDVRDVATEGVGQDVSTIFWADYRLVLKETGQIIGQVASMYNSEVFMGQFWKGNEFTKPVYYISLDAAKAAVEKRYLECKR